jgi:hypothetical protein
LVLLDLLYNTKNITEFFDEIFEKSIKDFATSKEIEVKHMYTLLLSAMTKLNFEKVDKRFSTFGEMFTQGILSLNGRLECDFQMSALSDLLLTNLSFFQEKIFPYVDLQGIENKSQFMAVIDGKYFKYFTNSKKFHQDIQFKFE